MDVYIGLTAAIFSICWGSLVTWVRAAYTLLPGPWSWAVARRRMPWPITERYSSSSRVCSISSAWPMLTISPSGKSHEPFSLQRRRALRPVHLRGLRDYPAQHRARPDPLRLVLFRDVCRRSFRGRLGDVVV